MDAKHKYHHLITMKNGAMKCHLFLLLLLGLQCCSNQKVQKRFHPNGKLLSVVTLDNLGRKNGIEVEYFESGDTSVYRNWLNGKRNGKSAVYFRNGKVEQVNHFKNGVRCCEALFYDEKGFLKEIQYLNSTGNVIDYKKFNAKGMQIRDPNSSFALAVPKKDTIELGEYYEAEIRLGNKRWDSIRVVLGAWDGHRTLVAPSLPSIDSVTSLLRVKANQEGTNSIDGTIIEVSKVYPDSAVIHTFSIFFFVTNRKARAI